MSLDLKFEEDIEKAVEILTAKLGPQGRMLPSGVNVNHNLIVEGPRKTKLWYGDLDLAEDMPKVEAAAKLLGFGLNLSKM